MSAISVNATVRAADGLLACDVDDEAILLNVRTGTYYGLDAVGQRVWQLLQQPQTVASLRDVLVGEFDVDADRCERDLMSLLAGLAGEQLIDVTDARAV